ncbi:MAG: hypothetical protein ACFFBD_08485, partial [Candidatus Hodarchaeota archaeon]
MFENYENISIQALDENSKLEDIKLSKVGILAHGDGDGLSSAAIIKRFFPSAMVYFSKAVSLPRDLRHVIQELGDNPHRIFIVDIAVNPRSSKKLFDTLSLIPDGCSIHY